MLQKTCLAILLAAVTSLVATSVAAPPPITITDAGYYVTIVDDAGEPTMVRVEHIVDLRSDGHSDKPTDPTDPETPPPSDPEQPETPDPPPLTGIAKEIAELATEVGNPSDTQRHAIVYETVKDAVFEKKVAPAKAIGVIKASTDVALENPSAWTDCREKVSEYFTSLAQEGRFSSVAQVYDAIEEVRRGLLASVPEGESISVGDGLAVISKTNSIVEVFGK